MTRRPTIALLAALHTEMTPTLRRLRLVRASGSAGPIATGVRGNATIHAYVSGVGKTRAEQCLDRILATARPDTLILLGFAGALSPSLQVGDVFEPIVFGHPDTYRPHPQGGRSIVVNPVTSTLLTVDRPVLDPAEKSRLYDTMDCPDAVDMETYHVQRKLRDAGVPSRVIRAITDAYDQKLEPEVMHWLDAQGRPRPARVMRDMIRRPALLAHARALRRASRIAGEALARRVEGMVDELITDGSSHHEA